MTMNAEGAEVPEDEMLAKQFGERAKAAEIEADRLRVQLARVQRIAAACRAGLEQLQMKQPSPDMPTEADWR